MRTHGILYKSVEQTVILYGIESWVVTGEMLKSLEGFHHRAVQRIAVMTVHRVEDIEWEYPSLDNKMKSAGIRTIK